MSIMREEVFSQPRSLGESYEKGLATLEKLRALLKKRRFDRVCLIARGSSANAAVYFKYLCEIECGVPAELVYPSVYTLYGGHMNMENTLAVAVSQGGRGEDIRITAEKMRGDGAYLLAVTNDPESPLAKAADTVLPLFLSEEKSMAATKSFSAELLQLGLLACALGGGDEKRFAAVPELYTRVLSEENAIRERAADYGKSGDCFVLGRGWSYAVARELCCKLQETCFVNATPYSTADFLHGPYALIQPGRQVIMFIADDEAAPCGLDMLERIKRDGGEALVFTDSSEIAGLGEKSVLLPKTDPVLMPFVFTAAAQVFACTLTEIRGTDPDVSRNLSKYTVTV